MKYVLMIVWNDGEDHGVIRVNLQAEAMSEALTESEDHIIVRDGFGVESARVFAVTEEAKVDVEAIFEREREGPEADEVAAERQKKLDLFNKLKAELNL